MGGKFLRQVFEYRLKLPEFGMILSVNGAHLLKERADPEDLLAGVLVMRLLDVRDDIAQRNSLPVDLAGWGTGRVFAASSASITLLI